MSHPDPSSPSAFQQIQNQLAAKPDWLLLFFVSGLLILFRAWLTSFAKLELHFDEALYWAYSQNLDWSYYAKGPLIAWLIALSEFIFGQGEWQVRLPGWIASSVFFCLVFYFTRHVWHSRAAAWWSFALLVFTPTYFTIGLVMTPDNLMWLFWAWGLWAIYMALFDGQRFAWYQTGAAVGLGALTKLSIGLLPAFVGIWMLFKKSWWHHFRNPHLWLALLVMIFFMSPLIYWNATNDWVMLRHEQGHVSSRGYSLARGLEFIIGQIMIMSPVVAILAIIKLRKKPKQENLFFLWILGIAWILFFLFKALDGKVQVNWPSASYISLIVLFAGTISNFTRRQRGWLYFGMVFSTLFMLVYYFPNTIGYRSADVATIGKMKAWREPVATLSQKSGNVSFILTDSYTVASELAFYWPTKLPVYIAGNETRRFNQFDLWPGIDREAGNDGLYIDTSRATPPQLNEAFKSCTPLEPVDAIANDGSIVRTLYAHFCKGYIPIKWPVPGRY